MATFFPDLVDPERLRQLAQIGVDAARQAGASYADIRMADARQFSMNQSVPPVPFSAMSFEAAYGIRVMVDGAWAFAFGAELSADALARTATAAVNTARGLAKIAPAVATLHSPMTAAPVVRGEWATPFDIDPFAISPDDHAKLLGAYKEMAERVANWDYLRLEFNWAMQTRVFASSEGSLVTQRLARAEPVVQLYQSIPFVNEGVSLPVAEFTPQSAGFEMVAGAALQARIKERAEEVLQLNRYPIGRADLGRYAAVFDGRAMGAMIGGTLVRALEMHRALGREADTVGTSILAPIDEIVGRPLFSPLLRMTTDRAAPHFGAAKWDDEGVEAEAFPLIERGCVVDYFTTRQSASALHAWYTSQNRPVQSRGSAVAWSATMPPKGMASHIMVDPGTTGLSLEALAKQMGNGLLLRGVRSTRDAFGIDTEMDSDPQLAGGTFLPMMTFEVKRGTITRRLIGGAVQFRTLPLLQAITALGNATTCDGYTLQTVIPETWERMAVPVVAPAAQLAQVDMALWTMA